MTPTALLGMLVDRVNQGELSIEQINAEAGIKELPVSGKSWAVYVPTGKITFTIVATRL